MTKWARFCMGFVVVGVALVPAGFLFHHFPISLLGVGVLSIGATGLMMDFP